MKQKYIQQNIEIIVEAALASSSKKQNGETTNSGAPYKLVMNE